MKKQKNVIRSKMTRAMALVMTVVMTAVMILGGIPSIPAKAEGGAYPYMIFAVSDEEGAVTLNANNTGFNGSVATNGTIAVIGGNCNINGTRTERAGENGESGEPLFMPDLRERVINTYFATGTEEHAGDYALEEININVNTPIEGDGEVLLTGNINLNAGIMAQEDIIFDGEVKNSGDVVLYSASGNVVINSTNVNLNGLVYAPYGEIRITSMNVNMNNVILIAQKVTIEAGSINGGMNQGIARFIGTEYNVIEGGTGNDRPVNPENPDPVNPDPVDPENPEIDWSVDTDGDGLPDALEEEIGTDPEVADTDGDGLSDYEEIFITGTDPLNPSSIQSGVSDADADSDGDGIPNREEIDKGLNPASADSDYDGISDYDELYVYGTDPVNADSDGDGIKDGDEISLGLDPLNGSTNGVPDGEYMIHQTVDADSEALAEINTADSPYRMSIEVDAAGYVAGNLDAGETPYAHTIENDAILGNAVGLEYQDGNVESVTLKFEIAEAYRENEIGMFPGEEEIEGIKRLNVFKYFEDINMLLPIETKFDMENHIIYTEVDEFGTYCLMDLEKWLLNFDLPEAEAEVAALSIDLYEDEEDMQPEEGIYFGCTDEYNEEDSIWQEGEFIEPEELESLVMLEEAYVMEDMPMLMALDLGDGVSTDIDNSNIDNASIDIVFILQCAGSSPADFQRQKDMIVRVAQRLEANHPDASIRIGVLAFQSSIAYWLNSDGEKWFTSSASLENVLDIQGYIYTFNNCRVGKAFELFCRNADLREDAARFVYTVYNGNTGFSMWDVYTQNSICNKFDIHYSEIYPKGYSYQSKETEMRIMALIAYTKGIFIEFDGFTAGVIYEHIRQNVAPVVQPVDFIVILPTGWKQITLTQPLNSENGANSDKDSLTDWEEVNTNMISWDANGEIVLPTFYECMQLTGVSYAQSGLDRFLTEPEIPVMPLPNIDGYMGYLERTREILPINSDPTSEDTDGDLFMDGYSEATAQEGYYPYADPNPMKSDVAITSLANDYISIDYECLGNAQDWSEERNDKNDASYGGNQDWFDIYGTTGNDMIFCNGKCSGNDVQEHGCGLIAASDTLLYMMIGEIDEDTTVTFEKSGITVDIKDSYQNIDYETYINYVTGISDYCIINDPFGVPGFRVPVISEEGSLLNGIVDAGHVLGYSYSTLWPAWSTDADDNLVIIRGRLLEDIPVIFSYIDIWHMQEPEDAEKITIYKLENMVYNVYEPTNGHYMTITGVIEYSDDVKDLVGHKTMLRISTWGLERYVDYDWYAEHFGTFNNMLCIVKN